jgi:Ser/Thr protein kinase RdoA (MazF antagonist)
MTKVIERALTLWGMGEASYRLIATRENRVYRVDTGSGAFALRVHRKGYRTDDELHSELKWMDAIARGGVSVPKPMVSVSGEFLQVAEGHQVDVLTWLNGVPIGKTGEKLIVADRAGLFYRMGHEMARVHQISDEWVLPAGFTRSSWDRAGLVGGNPLWGRFWENPSLSNADVALFAELRKKADADLAEREASLDYGLIHADLVRENVMMDGNNIQLIDFDDGGFGFRLFDLATTLLKNIDEPDYLDLKDALVQGYLSVRSIDLSALDFFILLRSATYVGWIVSRMEEEGAEVRNTRFVRNCRKLAQAYLDDRKG